MKLRQEWIMIHLKSQPSIHVVYNLSPVCLRDILDMIVDVLIRYLNGVLIKAKSYGISYLILNYLSCDRKSCDDLRFTIMKIIYKIHVHIYLHTNT